MGTLTVGGQTEARWIEEAAEGAGVPNSGVLRYFADGTVKVTPRASRPHDYVYDVGDVNKVSASIAGVKRFEVTVEYRFQDEANVIAFLQDLCVRGANGRLKTWAIEVGMAVDAATKAYYTYKGAKPDPVEVGVAPDGAYVVTVTFKALDLTPATAQPALGGTTTRQVTPYGTGYFVFTGSTIESPAGTPIADSVKSSGFTVAHNLQEVLNAGSDIVKTYAEGRRVITYRGDIGVSDGGKALVDAVIAGTLTNIVIKMSPTAGKPKYTLVTAPLADIELPSDDSGGHLEGTLERTAFDIQFGTV